MTTAIAISTSTMVIEVSRRTQNRDATLIEIPPNPDPLSSRKIEDPRDGCRAGQKMTLGFVVSDR
jgi:hypothetical protein